MQYIHNMFWPKSSQERFIVLTSEYLQFFKKSSSKISEMGNFIFKVRKGLD